MRRWLPVVWVAALLAPASAAGQAVTFQAGPAHDGNARAAGIGPPLRRAWTRRVDGVPSYAVIAQGRVFVTVETREPSSPSRIDVLALSSAGGRVLWRRALGRVWSAGLAYDAGRLFVSRATSVDPGGLMALDPVTGEALWQTDAGSASGDPPVADGGAVYVRLGINGGWIAAHRQTDGVELWRHSPDNGTDGAVAVTPDAVYATLPCGDARALDRVDGALRWQTPRDCHGGGGSTPVYAGGRLYGREAHADPRSVTYDAASGAIVARWPTDYPPAFAGGVGLFADARRPGESLVFGHVLTARSIPSGRVRWRFAGDGYLDTAALIAGGTAYVGSGGGRVYGVSLRSGRRVWRASLGGPVHGSGEGNRTIGGLAAAGGLLVVPAYGRVVAFRGTRGAR